MVGYVLQHPGGGGELSVTDVKATIDNSPHAVPGVLRWAFLDGMITDGNRLACSPGHLRPTCRARGYKVIEQPGTYPQPLTPAPTPARAWPMCWSRMPATLLLTVTIDLQPAHLAYARDNAAQVMLLHTASTCTDMQTALATAAAHEHRHGLRHQPDHRHALVGAAHLLATAAGHGGRHQQNAPFLPAEQGRVSRLCYTARALPLNANPPTGASAHAQQWVWCFAQVAQPP